MARDPQIEHNARVHDRQCKRYERAHGEIYNDIEQDRIGSTVARVVARLPAERQARRALDVGCGTGNLTRHLLSVGMNVTAADVSTGSLDYLRARVDARPGQLQTFAMNGSDLRELESGSFAVVAAYSLLHHVPRYLDLVREMARVVAPGGVIYLDHEAATSSWRPSDELRRYWEVSRPGLLSAERWRKYTVMDNYIAKLRRLREPRFSVEGDIHVWPDDHIDWGQVASTLEQEGLQSEYEEYLLYRRGSSRGEHIRFATRCADTGMLLATKPAS